MGFKDWVKSAVAGVKPAHDDQQIIRDPNSTAEEKKAAADRARKRLLDKTKTSDNDADD